MSNAAPTTITNFDDGYMGKEILVRVFHGRGTPVVLVIKVPAGGESQ